MMHRLWLIVYVVAHVWWAVEGPPRWFNGRESYLPGGWLPVVLGGLALAASLAAAAAPGRMLVAAGNAVAGVALLFYSVLFPIMLASLLFEGVRPGTWASVFATGGGAVAGVLSLRLALREWRRAVGACPACGRVHGRSPESRAERAPAWAFAAAYLAVAGYAARISPWLADLFAGRWTPSTAGADGVSWTALNVFVLLMSLAGTLLPLALVHRWGRIWPAWVVPLRGRPVPRWLVLGTGLFMGAGLTVYFGTGTIAWIRGDFGGPLVPLLLEMGGYDLWGLGLLVASAAYLTLTRPPCPARTAPAAPSEALA